MSLNKNLTILQLIQITVILFSMSSGACESSAITWDGEDSSMDTLDSDINSVDTSSDTQFDDPTTLILPIIRGDKYVLEYQQGENTWYFECIKAGGKITSFKLNGLDIIANSTVGKTNGSTFWTSPQSDWEWPPPDELDIDNYSATVDNLTNTITLTSPVVSSLGVQIVKTFSVNTALNSLNVNYTIINVSSATKQMAPWEITRVNPNGLTFYPSGVGTPTSGQFNKLPYVQNGAITWFQHSASVTDDSKLYSDGGEGWIAHTDGKLMFVKSFQNQQASGFAPEEAEIEIYSATSYVEVEQQGAYETIAAGGSTSWNLNWHLHALPATVSPTIGNEDIVELIENILNK